MTIEVDRHPPIVTVVSPKGGTGKTSVASNLATALSLRTPSVLVDLDLYCGDVEWAFGLHPAYRLTDVARRLREDSGTEIEAMLTARDGRLSLLCAPDSHISADGIVAADVSSITRRLVSLHRPVVFDTGPGMSDFSLDALEAATHVVVVTTTDVAAVQAATRLLDTTRVLRLDESRLALVVNRSTSTTGLGVADVEQRLGIRAVMQIPDSRHVTEALNTGRPIVESHPESHIAGDFIALADSMLGLAETRRRSSWWKRSQ